jgi:hypothetical protein
MAPPSVKSQGSQKRPQQNDDLWKDAYNALKEDPRGKKLLKKLSETVHEEQKRLGKPIPKLRSEEGRKQLLVFINRKSAEFASKKTSEDVGRVCDLMLSVKDIVAAGAAASPFATIAVSALFMAFSVRLEFS